MIGGREWSRREWFEDLDRSGLPPIVLVSVLSATRQVLLCSITWGKRPAFAFLVREKKPTPPDAIPRSDARGIFSVEEPFRLTYLLLSRP